MKVRILVVSLALVALLSVTFAWPGSPLALAAPPANDDVSNATAITSLPFTDALDTREATRHWTDPWGCYGDSPNVWYTFTPDTSRFVRVETLHSSTFAGIDVFTGSPGAFSPVTCGAPTADFLAVAGTTYTLMISGPGGDLVLDVTSLAESPDNDKIENATSVASLPFGDAIDTRAATRDPGDPSNCYGWAGNVWYVYVADGTQVVEVTTEGSSYDALIEVYSGSPGDLTFVTCDRPVAKFLAQTGVTYYLMISGTGDSLALSVGGLGQPPPSDKLEDATSIQSLPFSHAIDTRAATRDSSDPSNCYGGGNVWYAYTPANAELIHLTTENGTSGAGIDVYTGSPGALNWVQCGQPFDLLVYPGATYYFMVSSPGHGGDVVLDVTRIAVAPPNDDIENATLITSLPFHDQLDIRVATRDLSNPGYCWPWGTDVWYAYTPQMVELLYLTTEGGTTQAGIEVYTGSPGALTGVTCGPPLNLVVYPGATYYFALNPGLYPTGDNLVLDVTRIAVAPPNDDVENATVIASLPFHDQVDARVATSDPSDPSVCWWPSAGEGTVWYSLAATENTWIRASTEGSAASTGIDVFAGSPGSLTGVACGLPAQFLVTAGTTYYLKVYGGGERLVLDVTNLGPNLDLEIGIDTAAVNVHTGAVTLGGTVTCNQRVSFSLTGWVRQKLGRKIIAGQFSSGAVCEGQARWSVTVRSNQGAFGGGQAEVLARVEGCALGCDSDEEIRVVKLKGGGK